MAANLHGENAAERLLELGAHLGLAGKHRLAALAFASAASGASGASPSSRLDALYYSARNLYNAAVADPAHSCASEDLKRARATIQKALVLARGHPGAFTRTMRLLALLESVHMLAGDARDAMKASKKALLEMRRELDGTTTDIWPWWVYFRARMLDAAARGLALPRDARRLAAYAADHVEGLGDGEGAAAFLLAGAQVALSEPAFDLAAALPNFERAAGLLAGAGVPEHAPPAVACIVLHGLALLAAGRTAAARAELAEPAARALELLDRRGLARTASPWTWAPAPVLRALLQHFLARALSGRGGGGDGWVHAVGALQCAGVARDLRGGGGGGGEGRAPGARALAVALLDSAARARLARVDFAGAAPLVRAALVRAAPAPGGAVDVAGAAACLLAAEYYALAGTFAHAQAATGFLKQVFVAAGAPGILPRLGDVLQKALAYHSLLTGEARLEPGSPAEGAPFVSAQVRAAALLADGVFHMRQSRVLEAREALQEVMGIMQDGSTRNEQVLGNALIILSSLFLVHEQIGEAPARMTANAALLAEAGRDLVTEVRAKRQSYKIVSRAQPRSQATAEALAQTKCAVEKLRDVQSEFQEIVLE